MAERLAPEKADPRITSRPERPRGRARRWLGRFLAVVTTVALLFAGALFTTHFLTIHRSAQEIRSTALVPPEMPARVLVVIARPGQELPMAGTLAALDRAGAQVSLLSLTSGEAQPPAIDFAESTIPEIRADELGRAGELLGVDEVVTAGYTDGELLAADPAKVTRTIAKAIRRSTPSVLLTVSDLSGSDDDSQAVAAYALAAAQVKGSGVARVWTVTRGDGELDWSDLAAGARAATQGDDTAAESVAGDDAGAESVAGDDAGVESPAGDGAGSEEALVGGGAATPERRGLRPEPQVAVRIDEATTIKGEVLLAHGSQSPDLAEATYPYADRIPAWAYFRFWDREYFALAWGAPLQ